MPCVSAPAVTAVTVSVWSDSFGGPATSLTRRSAASISTATPSVVLALSAPGTGASFTSVTVIDTSAGTDAVRPSDTVNVKLSLPLKSAAGV